MECLINSAIANAKKPTLMATAFKDAVMAGRNAFLAKNEKKLFCQSASSPLKGFI